MAESEPTPGSGRGALHALAMLLRNLWKSKEFLRQLRCSLISVEVQAGALC